MAEAAVAIGAPMAWLSARTDLPWSRAIRSLVMASFVTPPFLGAFAWVMLAGPNAGLLNKLWRGLTGADDALLNIFSMPGLVFVVTIYTFPYVYIMIAKALALFGSPAILALPAGFHTITTQVWSLFQFPPKVELAAAVSIPLLLATA